MQYESIIDAYLAYRLAQYRFPSGEPIWSLREEDEPSIAFYGCFSSIMLEAAAQRLLDDDVGVKLDAIKAVKSRGATIVINYYANKPKQDVLGMSFEMKHTRTLTVSELYAFTELKDRLVNESHKLCEQLLAECLEIKAGGLDSMDYSVTKMEAVVASIAYTFDAHKKAA